MLLATRCPICRRPDGSPCPECVELLEPAPKVPRPLGLSQLHAALVYDGAARLLVAGLKYRNARSAVSWVAEAMVSRLPEPHGCDVVTWAPTSDRRRHQRGFDQSELLARAVARRLHLPIATMLRRRPGPSQTGRSAADRRDGVGFCARRSVEGLVVLVVDDVITTGATLGAAGQALVGAGAASVVGLVAGATPPPGR
ncbi:MAG: ComF family protein [Acidimicrobiia bacterium]|nr:ComF family protein [Acidimicrobiia bacterium]